MHTRSLSSVGRLTTTAALLLIFAVSLQARDWWPFGKEKNKDIHVVIDDTPLRPDVQKATSFADVVDGASASVVNVVSSIEKPPQLDFNGDPFSRFFGNRAQRPRAERPGVGSGVIIAEKGYVITNAHVVESATSLKVVLPGGRKEYTAELVGADSKSDIAVLKIEGDHFPAITLGDSELLRVGDTVLAIGNPFGVGQTVTRGIVSATGRGIGINDYEDFIQTDASINPGNSGGALVDAQGRLVGINTAILSRSGGNQGLGFAVPINMARNIVQQLMQHGSVSRGFLGVSIQDIAPEMAQYFGIAEGKGVLVTEVTVDSAADVAGIEPEDVILELNDRLVEDARDLRLLVAGTLPGTQISLKVLRDGKEQTLTAELKILPGSTLATVHQSDESDTRSVLRGVAVEDLTMRLAREHGIDPDVRGAFVVEVAAGCPASRSHLGVGDVILQINRTPVNTADEAIAASRAIKGHSAMLKVLSRGGTFFAVISE